MLQGLSVATAGYVALFVGAWALSRARKPAGEPAPRETAAPAAGPGSHSRAFQTAGALSIALVAVFAWQAGFKPTPVPLSRPLSNLPLQLGAWRGGQGVPGAIPLVAIPGSDRLERVYLSSSRAAASLLVLYVPDQSGAHEVVGYRTTPLLDGTAVSLRAGNAGSVEVRRSEIREGERSIVTFAWYDIDGHVTGSPVNAKLRTGWNALARGRSNGALVAVRAEYLSGDEERAGEPELRALVGQILDSLRSVLPNGRPAAA